MRIDRRVAPVDQRLPDPEQTTFRQITLAQTTVEEIDDAAIGLDPNPAAQTRAEQFVRATLSYRAKQNATAP